MKGPFSGGYPKAETLVQKRSGRLRAYAVPSQPRPARRTTKFKCRNCGQRVRVDSALQRRTITCPTCSESIPAPQPGRLWLEICGGILIFMVGVGFGHGPFARHWLPVAAPGAVMQQHGKKAPASKESAQQPGWFASQEDGN